MKRDFDAADQAGIHLNVVLVYYDQTLFYTDRNTVSRGV